MKKISYRYSRIDTDQTIKQNKTLTHSCTFCNDCRFSIPNKLFKPKHEIKEASYTCSHISPNPLN